MPTTLSTTLTSTSCLVVVATAVAIAEVTEVAIVAVMVVAIVVDTTVADFTAAVTVVVTVVAGTMADTVVETAGVVVLAGTPAAMMATLRSTIGTATTKSEPIMSLVLILTRQRSVSIATTLLRGRETRNWRACCAYDEPRRSNK
jgi:hypothetical protein